MNNWLVSNASATNLVIYFLGAVVLVAIGLFLKWWTSRKNRKIVELEARLKALDGAIEQLKVVRAKLTDSVVKNQVKYGDVDINIIARVFWEMVELILNIGPYLREHEDEAFDLVENNLFPLVRVLPSEGQLIATKLFLAADPRMTNLNKLLEKIFPYEFKMMKKAHDKNEKETPRSRILETNFKDELDKFWAVEELGKSFEGILKNERESIVKLLYK